MRRIDQQIQHTACGFTLAELMVTIGLIAILAAAALPQFQKTMQRGHRRAAKDILLTIYAGEHVHKATEGVFFDPDATNEWDKIFMDNPNVASPLPVTFTVTTTPGPPPTFTATATSGSKSCTIDQNKTLTGMWDIACNLD
jgi:prepilin-type N-terminal cleavage/methylation domain-containing protein